MANITILGTGEMGSRMARHLLKAGHRLTVWNRHAEKASPLVAAGATLAGTPREAVAAADFAMACVRDDQASSQVWLDARQGALLGMPPHAVAIESSTLTVMWVRELAQHFSRHARALVDAPVSGTRPQAESAQLVYMVGGTAEHYAAVLPVLQVMGSSVHHAGAVGSGAAVKLMVNGLLGIQIAAVAELLGLARHYGVSEAVAADIITVTPVCSPSVKAVIGKMVAGDYAPLFPIDLVEKDFSYITQAATLPMPLARAAHHVFQQALQQGLAEENIHAVAKLYRQG